MTPQIGDLVRSWVEVDVVSGGLRNSRLNPRIKECLDKANECERLAAQARDPEVRAALAEVSRQWRALARHLERSPLAGLLRAMADTTSDAI
jgi:hypothetical protein